MRKIDRLLRVCVGLPLALGGSAWAQTPPAAEPAFATPASVRAATRDYVLTLYTPSLTNERIDVVTRVLAPTVRSRQWTYELPDLKSERRKLWQTAEWTCKYMDWRLPNECRIVWHDVYADLPVLTMQRSHSDLNLVEWAWEERTIRIEIPRWTWTETTFTLGVPEFVPEDLDEARTRAR